MMNMRHWAGLLLPLVGALLLLTPLDLPGQPETKKQPDRKEFEPKGPKGGPGGFGGPMGQVRKLVKQFDKDGDGRLNKEERKAAREFLKKDGRGGPGGKGGFGKGKGG